MSIVLQKGEAYSAEYSTTDFTLLGTEEGGYNLTSDLWVGSVSLYATYPGTPTLTITSVATPNGSTIVRNDHVLALNITNAEITNLATGTYTVISTMSNAVLGVTISSLTYATVLDINLSAAVMCKLFGTIEKGDGTPTGSATSSLVNIVGGTQLQAGWKGVDVKVSFPSASSDASSDPHKIVGIETLTTTTNAAGYFEIYVIQGLTVTVLCSSFGKSVVVATTGLTEKDLSTEF